MNRRWLPLIPILALTTGAPARASAQLGPLIDWIHEMSGPRFFQWGTTLSLGYQPGLELRLDDLAALDSIIAGLPDRDVEIQMEGVARTLAATSTDIVSRGTRMAGVTRYRAVLVDRIQSQARQLIRDIRDPGGRTPLTNEQIAARLDRIGLAIAELETPDALDRGNGIRGRLAITGGSSVLSDARKDPDTAAVNIISLSPTAEYLFSRYLAFETGVGLHYFFGDFEPFWSVSFPVLIVARPLVTNRSRFLRSLRINFGANIFAPLDGDAFEPVAQIEDTGFEWVWTGFISLDFPIGR